jgi:hypothetical protein
MKTTEWIGLETLAELQGAAPLVTVPAYETVKAIIKAMGMYAGSNKSQFDCKGTPYWMAGLTELIEMTGLSESLEPKKAGSICRSMKLVMHRRNDGFKVAYSEKHLGILKKAFGLA